MTFVLVRKLLRDILVAWIVVAVLLFLFQVFWARITMRVTTQIITAFQRLNIPPEQIMRILLQNQGGESNEVIGQMVQAIVGGENIELDKARDFMSVAYVHPLVLTILGVWAIGRAANAIAGEIDRGTMELLLAQPIRRSQLILAHLCVDAVVIPSLCLAMWLGTYCGVWWNGLQTSDNPLQRVDPLRFLPALLCVAMLLFSISGGTLAISAMGRARARVWGYAMTLFFVMFLINVFAQIFGPPLDWFRPFTVYYHYQPQVMLKTEDWWTLPTVWLHLGVLAGIGSAGYGFACWVFCRRDLPAPL